MSFPSNRVAKGIPNSLYRDHKTPLAPDTIIEIPQTPQTLLM